MTTSSYNISFVPILLKRFDIYFKRTEQQEHEFLYYSEKKLKEQDILHDTRDVSFKEHYLRSVLDLFYILKGFIHF